MGEKKNNNLVQHVLDNNFMNNESLKLMRTIHSNIPCVHMFGLTFWDIKLLNL